MKINRIKKIKINCYEFKVNWNKTHRGGSFTYDGNFIDIGTKMNSTDEIFMILCHELMEICAVEMHVRYYRPDCDGDYLFSYDHKQHDTMIKMFSSLISQFIKKDNHDKNTE